MFKEDVDRNEGLQTAESQSGSLGCENSKKQDSQRGPQLRADFSPPPLESLLAWSGVLCSLGETGSLFSPLFKFAPSPKVLWLNLYELSMHTAQHSLLSPASPLSWKLQSFLDWLPGHFSELSPNSVNGVKVEIAQVVQMTDSMKGGWWFS